MREGYVLEWFDNLISVKLNPAKTRLNSISDEEIFVLQNQIDEEKAKVTGTIKNLIFSMESESKIVFGIKQFHASLIALLDQAMMNKICNSKYPELKQILVGLIRCIKELLLLIEDRFVDSLNKNEALPPTYFNLLRKELLARISTIENNLNQINEQPFSKILTKVLNDFLGKSPKEHAFTFQEISYIKELCSRLEDMKTAGSTNLFSELDKILIYMNFNDRLYADSLIQRVAVRTGAYEKKEEKIERLLFNYKLFKQMHQKPGVIFDSEQEDLSKELCNWFFQEISYLQKTMSLPAETKPDKENMQQPVPPQKSNLKVLCQLSTDQTGLILRSADELRVLVAKSMSEVFKTIVPHLSTPYKENLSYDGMRSKSYVAEDRDKQIAIETLERMIKKIRDY